MARTVETEPLKKHTLFLYEGDFDRMSLLYADDGGASVVIRRIIRAHLNRIEAGVSPLPTMKIENEL
jgi:hypothetical protein